MTCGLRKRLVYCNSYYNVIGISIARNKRNCNIIIILSYYSFFLHINDLWSKERLVYCNSYYNVIETNITKNRRNCNAITIIIHRCDNL